MAAHGRYSLLRKIADGGTAEVFLAHMEGSAGFKRLVVLKRVRPNLWADEAFRKGLLDEAHIMMGLHHGNIVQVLDLGVAAQRYFLAFELVDGWTLSQVITRAKAAGLALPLNLALHVMAETCRALAYAHSRSENGQPLNIVHRDVSPQNVLLSEQGEVKLADFGIARARTRVTTSQVGSVKGKPAFMSPEQADGRELDARSDLFPIGTMLYQLVTSELPFSAPTALEEMARVSQGKFVSPEKKRPDLPKELVQLINKALERKVDKRFQNADEMVVAIEKLQRTVLEAAGQTELKAWLATLAAKDGAQPLSRAGEPPKPVPEHVTEPVIELQDEDVEIITRPPIKQISLSATRKRRWPIFAAFAALLALGAALRLAPEFLAEKPSSRTPSLVAVAPPPAPFDAGVAEEVDAGQPATADAAVEASPDAAAEASLDAGSAAPAGPLEVATPTPMGGLPGGADAGQAAAAPTIKPPAPSATIATDDAVSVLFESEPTGAQVRIDKHVFGKTPIPLRLKIGLAFELAFSKDGFKETKLLHFVTRRNGQRAKAVLEREP